MIGDNLQAKRIHKQTHKILRDKQSERMRMVRVHLKLGRPTISDAHRSKFAVMDLRLGALDPVVAVPLFE